MDEDEGMKKGKEKWECLNMNVEERKEVLFFPDDKARNMRSVFRDGKKTSLKGERYSVLLC